MSSFLDAAADLLLGSVCPGCHKPGWNLCTGCALQLEGEPVRVPLASGFEAVAACAYRPVLEHVIPRYKDDGALQLERLLARLLARSVGAAGVPADSILVPVPSLPRAVRARGFDHAARLARRAARLTGLHMRPWRVGLGAGATRWGWVAPHDRATSAPRCGLDTPPHPS
ncbi:hypothetical protein G7085_00725 [Tessaracoccus sp. HDW20]|uniref:ComF family protein n=1 Tax=Tessaracoccus coleopterorum TaxID=2714950 RepID=UPI0018D4D4A9|nr:hypothetical protein [Tessaracoccus coleopterorum]NHB83718.1 hypothetical protein [Tessaracoccus coleopterorum]